MGIGKGNFTGTSVDPVGEYDPSYYGYGDFQKGKKPQDFFK
jgi:hypothetical protein